MKHQIMTVMLDAFLITNAFPHLSFCQNVPLLFSMVHLLYRLYGVDAPEHSVGNSSKIASEPQTEQIKGPSMWLCAVRATASELILEWVEEARPEGPRAGDRVLGEGTASPSPTT